MGRLIAMTIGVIALSTACATGGGRLSAPPAGLDLHGSWRLNEEASAARSAGDTARVGARRPPGGANPGQGGRRGGARMGGFGGGMELVRPVLEFALTQTDTSVTFRFATKRAVVVPTNGRRTETSLWPGVSELELKAHWTEHGLRMERSVPGGRPLVEVYSRIPETGQLLVTLELSSPIGTRTLQRVYDRVEG